MTRARARSFRATAAMLAVGLAISLAAGCDVNVQDGVGPRVPIPDVEGLVVRGGSPAVYLEVELHNVANQTMVAETESNLEGHYGFPGVRSGLWEVRAESRHPGDFASVSRQFYRADGDGRYQAATLDISARGAALETPTDGAAVTTPTPFVPLDFLWTRPDVAGVASRVQVTDEAGQDVWKSDRVLADSVRWNGYGTEGAYYGFPVPSGKYAWRVKFEFPDTTEARTPRQSLLLQ